MHIHLQHIVLSQSQKYLRFKILSLLDDTNIQTEVHIPSRGAQGFSVKAENAIPLYIFTVSNVFDMKTPEMSYLIVSD